MRAVRRNHPPDGTVRPDDVVLADDLDQRPGSQPVGQGARRVVWQAAGFEQIAHTAV